MAISERVIREVKFPPECIPDSWFGAVVAAAEVAPPILDLRRFQPFITILSDIQVPANALAVLRARYDTIRVEENTAAMIELPTVAPNAFPVPGAWRLLAKDYLYFNFFGIAPGIATYTTHYNVWAFPPTVAHKLLYGITLNAEERAISEELGISNTVEKGLLPLPIPELISREYNILGEETHSRSVNVAVAGTIYTIESIYPRPGEFVVLTRVAAAAGTVAQDVRLIIDRDDDANYAQIMCRALSPIAGAPLVVGGEIACFIPSIREIRLTTTSTAAPGPHLFRYTYQRIKLTNLLRCRFGLVSKDEVPGDTWQKVKGGVI